LRIYPKWKRENGNMNSHLLCLLISFALLTACNPATLSTPTITEATKSVATPVQNNDQSIVLYRGNTQRTGVYDVPAIRQMPEIQWQSKISPLWLMPPLITDDILYTGGGDGWLYALNIQTGEKIWSASGFGQMEATGAIAGDELWVFETGSTFLPAPSLTQQPRRE
jgi:hypothetical protein